MCRLSVEASLAFVYSIIHVDLIQPRAGSCLKELFLERLSVRHSYKLPLFGHGPGHVLVCIPASLLAAATGLILVCITKILC